MTEKFVEKLFSKTSRYAFKLFILLLSSFILLINSSLKLRLASSLKASFRISSVFFPTSRTDSLIFIISSIPGVFTILAESKLSSSSTSFGALL
ncbi:hypothetical protein CEP13_14790 [Cylindrospermopsis raciborskii C03]|uniref:hypothetical protein n=1 Tax=Cylindrospermopsis raciborskii TaxID=77022 RepID=UPI000C9E28A1|nr:hypothetical protein [Cylindrospermopsis raciborskii]PNJ92566.1 hypothetical protein CEP13_14790 [Cylindrospermopsis raciborskii C03]